MNIVFMAEGHIHYEYSKTVDFENGILDIHGWSVEIKAPDKMFQKVKDAICVKAVTKETLFIEGNRIDKEKYEMNNVW